MGGKYLEHDYGLSRSIGYFLEPLNVLCLFAKRSTQIKLQGGSRYNSYDRKIHRGKDSQGEEVMKAYTRTTLDCDLGRFEVQLYRENEGCTDNVGTVRVKRCYTLPSL
ncbi:hypothetical protein RND81_02G147600 [Saponaria officinalis]|uniref:Uncharacterized protein n=1 Tax=Saponaria officinalis TaxID=3572 RepID=A0AAW1MMY1_SAPOF